MGAPARSGAVRNRSPFRVGVFAANAKRQAVLREKSRSRRRRHGPAIALGRQMASVVDERGGLPRRPRHIRLPAAADTDAASLKEATALENGLRPPEERHFLDEVEEVAFLVVELPVKPGELVVLTVRVVVAVLRVAELIAAAEHRHSLREKQRGDEIAAL